MAIGTGLALLGGSALGAGASYLGAKEQGDAANAASRTARNQFAITRQDNMPWLRAGEGGLNALATLYGLQRNNDGTYGAASDPMAAMRMLQQDPSYQFRFQQGQGALENSAAARGGLMSGNMLRALTDYGQNMASTEFGNVANRLAGLANVGQGQAQYLGNAGMNMAQQVGQNQIMAGQARASGYAGVANAIGNGLSQYGMYKGMKG